jgi:short-subunit dehydrogenase
MGNLFSGRNVTDLPQNRELPRARQPLAGKIALVTGATSGIGNAITQALAAEGVDLILVGRSAGTLKPLTDRLAEDGRTARGIRADLTIEEDVAELVKSIDGEEAELDLLVHAAGMISLGAVEMSKVEDFDAQYRCNARAPYQLTRSLLPLLRKSRGQIVFLNSTAGLTARGHSGAYAASKHALKAIAESLRQEVNEDGIRVLSLYLGRTATPMQERVFSYEGRAYKGDLLLQPSDVARVLITLLSLGPTAEVTDISMRPFMRSYGLMGLLPAAGLMELVQTALLLPW